METRANYTLVGFFTLLVMAAAFGFVYWMATFGKSGEMAQLEIRIPGSASGLSVGAPVLFNGIRVGSVQSLTIDGVDPNYILAMTEVRASAPVYATTKAKLGIQGLTGQSHVELSGGHSSGQNILEEAVEKGSYAILTADESSVTNILATAEEILGSVKESVKGFQDFVDTAKGPLVKTAENAEKFSDALAANSDGISEFLKSVSSLSVTIQSVSGKLESVLTRVDTLVAAVEPDEVKEIVDNAAKISAEVADASTQVKPMVDEFKKTAVNLAKLSEDANGTLGRIDTLLASVDPDKVQQTVDNVALASEQARALVAAVDPDKVQQTVDNVAVASEQARALVAAVEPDKVKEIVDNAEKISAEVADASTQIKPTVDEFKKTAVNLANLSEDAKATLGRVDTLLAAVDPDKVQQTVDNVAVASEQARQGIASLVTVADTIGNHNGDIDQIITNVDQLSARLNEAALQVQATLKKIDGFMGEGDASGLIAEAKKTLETFQQVAIKINAHIGPIASNLQRFSGSGLRDFDALVAEARRSITRVERTITQIGDQPQSLIFGTSGDVKKYNGRRRR